MDDWYEPSEFDFMIEELKEKLRESVKQEIKDEMDRLRTENALLQDIKENWDQKVQELDAVKREYENAKRNAVSDAKKMKLKELFSDSIRSAWFADYEYKYIRDKCGKCDDKGYIHYKSPQGHECKEKCDCRTQILEFHPKEAEICNIIKKCYPPDYKPYIVTFDISRDKDDEFRSTTTIYDGRPFDDVERYRTVFTDKGKCQEFCEWLNKKERKKFV